MSDIPRFPVRVKSIEIPTGEEFVIEVPVVTTGGYQASATANDPALQVEQLETKPRNLSIGGSACKEFKAACSRCGDYTIEFVIKRPWEKEPVEKLVMQVTAVSRDEK